MADAWRGFPPGLSGKLPTVRNVGGKGGLAMFVAVTGLEAACP
jgi:hypothetical protein